LPVKPDVLPSAACWDREESRPRTAQKAGSALISGA
jgi:hypothetical protein